jgi:hypothetical protein
VYLFVCLLPGIVFILAGKLVWKKRPVPLFFLVQGCCIILLLLLPEVFPQWNPFYILYKKRIDFINEAHIWSAGSLVPVPELEPNAWSFVQQIPFALSLVLFRPFPWESHSMLMLFSSLENIFLVLLFLLPVIAFRKPEKKDRPFLLFCISFVLYLYLLIGTTTPILGSLVRYKIPGIPVLLIVVLFFTDHDKLFRRKR